jgi:hypothetical protein
MKKSEAEVVMARLDPAIHAFGPTQKAWITGPSPMMRMIRRPSRFGSEEEWFVWG